jgi:Fe-S-cluster containining protein
MISPPSLEDYRALLQQLDRWMDAAGGRHPGVVPCRAGCSACCHGPFDVTVADVELIQLAVDRLPATDRAEAVGRARRLLGTMSTLAPEWGAPWAIADLGEDRFDAVADALAAEPCPLLGDDGRCRIYAERPMVCRLIGLPMRSPAGRVIENACPIQDRFPAYAALAPESFELEAFEETEHACLRAAAGRLLGDADWWEYETTIAAILAPIDSGAKP